MNETFITSDLHIGHRNIIKFEPGRQALGADVDEMNEALIDRWNRTVGPRDHTIVVGDWAMGHLDETLPLTDRFNGTKTLIVGNHDGPFNGKNLDEYAAVFTSVLHGLVHLPQRDGLPPISLCHFPYRRSVSEYDERYREYHPEDTDGELLFHGHVHSAWKFRRGQVNVGCDVWDYRPRTPAEIVAEYERWATFQEVGA